jgi:hypothetical protein
LGRGNNAGNSLGAGTGNVTTSKVLYDNLKPTPINSTNVRLGAVFETTVVGIFDNVSSPNYGAGLQGIGGVGSYLEYLGSQTASSTTPVLCQVIDTVEQMSTSLNICTFLIDNKVYLTQTSSSISTIPVLGKTYFEIPLPR